jgi:hypothetical protein
MKHSDCSEALIEEFVDFAMAFIDFAVAYGTGWNWFGEYADCDFVTTWFDGGRRRYVLVFLILGSKTSETM